MEMIIDVAKNCNGKMPYSVMLLWTKNYDKYNEIIQKELHFGVGQIEK